MIEYTGYIRKIRFYSESSNYIVALIDVEQEDKLITMNGYMNNFNDYDKYLFIGDYEIHPKYGKQFKLSEYRIILAKESDEIIKYLSSPLFKGVGQKLAKQIVDSLGEDCLTIIKNDKHSLDCVMAMTEKKRDMIYEVLTNSDYDQEVMQFFMGHGISLKNLGLIQAFYKEKTLEVLQNNPYRLIEDIDGIGFKTADELALKTGGALDNPNRIKAAIVYSIKQYGFNTGSTYCLIEEIVKTFKQLIYSIEENIFYEYLDELIDNGLIIKENERYYYHEMYEAEVNIANYLKIRINHDDESIDESRVDQLLQDFEKNQGITYAKKQKEALFYFLKSSVMILTGGPGTGKSTIVHALLKIYTSLYPEDKIGLVAPTGRAAKRLTELTGIEACTIHRLLKWDLHTNTFAMNRTNPLDIDVLIIDEFSMVDCLLLSKLFDAGRKISKILFIGDYYQLPSVAPGNVLKDLIEAGVKTIELDEIFRQAKDSGIIQLAHHIINNEIDDIDLFDHYQDINFFPMLNYDVIKNVKTIVNKALEEGYDTSDIQVLAPMYQGVAGIDALNDALQDVFNPKDQCLDSYKIGRIEYRIGDKILQLKNRVDDNVFNGDIGILIDICRKDNFEYLQDTLIVDFDGNIVEYTSQNFNTITLAYCMSIHKSQGNEFKIVIMPVLSDYYIMLRRNLLYTAITRAKQSLFIMGDSKAFMHGLHNYQDNRRKTTLKLRFEDKPEISVYDFL
ncbi:MAG: ATP-dependent RecD-like DNA helicase [[Clostridium] spiroforme]|uniref:ATP-dependent RecD2 DNA helicase n=1 Tax=Thomasclavelia spiroformis TaxID=29348 RepID=A0A943I731_9FIRM|nr:ATP-dependent RecD-like DNA helicase [Thomasclavelia spiroformis]MBS5589165.1 ATP-dependent RecD-like DNA helicase [Thomasclavelia spiroformis]